MFACVVYTLFVQLILQARAPSGTFIEDYGYSNTGREPISLGIEKLKMDLYVVIGLFS